MKRLLCLWVNNLPENSIDALKAIAAWCKHFSPLVGIDPALFPQSVLLDITNVVHLFGSEERLLEKVADELRIQGWQLRLAAASTPGAAWALAKHGVKEVVRGRWPVGSTQYPVTSNKTSPLSPSPLSSLPITALRLPEPIVVLLHSLGVGRIDQLEALPRRELTSRFGPELLDCLDRVTGKLPEPLPAWNPPPRFQARWSAEFPTTRRETIEAALEYLVRRLAAMLTQADRGAMRLECLLTCLEGEPLQVVVGLFRPTAWANHLVQLLQVRFESLQLPAPVESICLEAVATVPLELRQRELFGEEQPRGEVHHLPGLIDRLSTRLGHTSVMRVRLIPDAQPELACHYVPLVERGMRPVIKLASKSPLGAHLPHIPRPLRLLHQPVRLPNGIEGSFSYAGQQHRVARHWGPERIETGWWRGRTVARDYYRIETTAGRRYWVFRRLPTGPCFLHGMFD